MSLASRSASARRFLARARRRRLRRLLVVVAAVGMVVVVSVMTWLIGWSGLFAVDDVSVEGTDDGALVDEVLAAAGAPLGTPLARVDTGAIAVRVSELPAIAEVEVHRSWPRTVTIEVTPRHGLATIKADGSWWLVDQAGVMFGETTKQPGALPVLRASTSSDDEAVRAAGVVVIAALPSDLVALVDSVDAKSEATIELLLDDGTVVSLGTADQVAYKAEVLMALMATQEEPPAAYDVSAPDHPAVTP